MSPKKVDNVRNEHIDWIINENAKYVNAKAEFWIQQDGSLMYIPDMGCDHLLSSIKKIDNDVKRLTGDLPSNIIKKMKSKKQELKKEYSKKIK